MVFRSAPAYYTFSMTEKHKQDRIAFVESHHRPDMDWSNSISLRKRACG
jgi:hypothetical protein